MSKLISFFRSNLEHVPEWKIEWDTILQVGEVPIDSAKIVRIDTNRWCYLLPVLDRDSLVGLVSSFILEDEMKEGELYRIRLNAQSQMSLPEFISPTDTLFCALSVHFDYYKKIRSIPVNSHVRRVGNGAYFRYRYELGIHVDLEDEWVVVTGSSINHLSSAIELFRFNGVPIRDYQIDNGYIGIFFCYGKIPTYDALSGEAYNFGYELSRWLCDNGYVYPLFTPDGSSDGTGTGVI